MEMEVLQLFAGNKEKEKIIQCKSCPRLVTWREAQEGKKLAYQDEVYWAKPVPGFGDEMHGS